MIDPPADAVPTHFVSASTLDRHDVPAGVAVFDVVWPDGCPARNSEGVFRLSHAFTDQGHRKGVLPCDYHYVITGWSAYA